MKFKSVCKFKIACEELQTVMVPLPDCASGEWGPTKATRLFGLVPITHQVINHHITHFTSSPIPQAQRCKWAVLNKTPLS